MFKYNHISLYRRRWLWNGAFIATTVLVKGKYEISRLDRVGENIEGCSEILQKNGLEFYIRMNENDAD